jgi:hypothetical protein
MYSNTKLLQKSDIYLSKKRKSPDHLLQLVQRFKKTEENDPNVSDEDEKDRIRKKILQKRIDAILKTAPSKQIVSDPVPFAKKKWISPLEQRAENENFHSLYEHREAKCTSKSE